MAGTHQRLNPQTTIGFDPDLHLTRLGPKFADQLMEPAHTCRLMRQPNPRHHLTNIVEHHNVIVRFGIAQTTPNRTH